MTIINNKKTCIPIIIIISFEILMSQVSIYKSLPFEYSVTWWHGYLFTYICAFIFSFLLHFLKIRTWKIFLNTFIIFYSIYLFFSDIYSIWYRDLPSISALKMVENLITFQDSIYELITFSRHIPILILAISWLIYVYKLELITKFK